MVLSIFFLYLCITGILKENGIHFRLGLMDKIYIFYFVLVHFDSALFLFLNYGQIYENGLTKFEIFVHVLYLDNGSSFKECL